VKFEFRKITKNNDNNNKQSSVKNRFSKAMIFIFAIEFKTTTVRAHHLRLVIFSFLISIANLTFWFYVPEWRDMAFVHRWNLHTIKRCCSRSTWSDWSSATVWWNRIPRGTRRLQLQVSDAHRACVTAIRTSVHTGNAIRVDVLCTVKVQY